MFYLKHKQTHKVLLKFATFEEALQALQDAAIPTLFYVSNK
jgi:hypothetical protein